jgi:hypothetical protein
MKCHYCSQPIEADGYGEYVHSDDQQYACQGADTFALPYYSERRRP